MELQEVGQLTQSTKTAPDAYRACSQCVMDTSDPEITFDADGVCSYCRDYAARFATEGFQADISQEKLNGTLAEVKKRGAGHKYDCVLGLSGGVDSSYVAYLAVRVFGLRPLAIHLDNGWNSELAVSNVEAIVNHLKIDLHTTVLNWHQFRDLQLSFLKAGVPNCEIPTDHAIIASLYHAAAKENIRYILSGSNFATESVMPDSWGYDSRDWSHINAIQKRFGTQSLKGFPHLALTRFAWEIMVKRIRFIPILNLVRYNKAEAIATIEKELGWRSYGRKHGESLFTRFFQEDYLPTRFGFDKRKAHLSCLIYSKQITRDEALRQLDQAMFVDREREDVREYVAKKFKLTDAELAELLQAEPRRHEDYPSMSWLFSKNSGTYQFARAIATGRNNRRKTAETR